MSFTNLNEQFHIFSKSPVRAGQTLGSARNKSGHTVTTSDIWAEDIPAFFYAYTEEQKDKFGSIASENDLCYDKTSDTLYYFKSDSWIGRNPLGEEEILFNSNAAKDKIYNDGTTKTDDQKKLGVVQYHKEKPVEAITSSNNNNSAGNGYTGRIKKSDETYISQFVSSMDKLVSGNPSSYYEPLILNGSNVMEESSEDTTEKKYIANSYAGIIQFHQDGFTIDESTGNFNGITASIFEYIGKKLDSTLSNISEDLNSDKSDGGVRVVQTNGKIESITVTPVTITNGSITDNGNNVISGNQVVDLIDNVKKELLTAGVQYKVLSQLEQLPEASETYKGYIYLMPESNRVSGSYLEYMCVQKEDGTWTWEQIGTTKTDLKGLFKDFSNLFNNNLSENLDNNFILFDNQENPRYISFRKEIENGHSLFAYEHLSSFILDLPALKQAKFMFSNTQNLSEFDFSLTPNITDGGGMFKNSGITSVSGELPHLSNAQSMFHETKITSFNLDMPKVFNAQYLFYNSDIETIGNSNNSLIKIGTEQNNDLLCNYMCHSCTSLESFYGDLEKASQCNYTFMNCSSLTNFYCNSLANLTQARNMFYGCTSLTVDTINRICDSVRNWSGDDKIHYFGLPSIFENEQDIINKFQNKGWTVHFNVINNNNQI